MMKTHKQFDISTYPFHPDIMSGLMWQLEIEGITENDNSLTIYANAASAISVTQISDLLNLAKEQNLIESFTVDESSIEEKNWNEEWEKTITVIEVNDKIAIKPSFREYTPKENQTVITIDPKMSFGTGDHETTKLVLSLLNKYLKEGFSVLDVGSGTGILSIASALLGAADVIGIDNDIWCLENGQENIELNNVNEKVRIKLAEIQDVDEGPFDLILANINKPILKNIINNIFNLLKQDEKVIISGLLVADRDDILLLYEEKGFSLIEEKILEEWIALVFSKGNRSHN